VDQILDMMIAAGEGLAAEHAAGLVHRDIKPENVLIGADGRARVGDFGLARDLDSREEPARSSPSSERMHATGPLTQTGAVLGTPAYMAPEQFSGALVDARADQFSFCVTLWEALWSERPFAGATFEALHAALISGERKPPPDKPRVPARIHRALARGLEGHPDRRFPTMNALLTALRPARRRRRTIALLAGGLALTGVAGYLALAHTGRSAVSCDDAGDPLAKQIPRQLGDKIRALGVPELARRSDDAIGRFASSIATKSELVCRHGRINRDWTPELVARSEACIAIAVRIAQQVLAVDSLQREQIGELLRRAQTLPAASECIDPTYLEATPAVPSDPWQLAQLVDARADLRIALTEHEFHQWDRLQARIEHVAQSPAHGDPAIAAGLVILRGLVASDTDHVADAEKLLSDGYYAARAIDDDVLTRRAQQLDPARHAEAVADRRGPVVAADRPGGRGPALAPRQRARRPALPDRGTRRRCRRGCPDRDALRRARARSWRPAILSSPTCCWSSARSRCGAATSTKASSFTTRRSR